MIKPQVNVRHHQLPASAGFALAYTEYCASEGSAQASVFLVHGLASCGLQFSGDAEYLAARGYRVLVPDLRGHGASEVPDAVTLPQFEIGTMAQDLIDILDHAHAQKVHWVGNSLGGILALHLLGTQHRQRLSSLALFGTCFSMSLAKPAGHLFRAAFLPGQAITAWITARLTTKSAEGRKAIENAMSRFNVAAGAAIVANVRSYDFVANALAFEQPILILRGGKDHAVNLRLRHDIGRFDSHENVQCIDFPLGGHCLNLDMPDAFRTALKDHLERPNLQLQRLDTYP
ncbi:alpha/beta fold hydrolase [Devosia pacifica]|uniref:alpha/beta fold hydrolase n=1 Tax=Devosia pacifica TaxID=1335967 RepID=UPI001679ACBF|nr:alpha/beta fold hydrolase [Devosia pacifica]